MDERMGIVGGGVMGSRIAQVLAVDGHEVWCYDVDEAALDRARTSDDALGRLHFTVAATTP